MNTAAVRRAVLAVLLLLVVAVPAAESARGPKRGHKPLLGMRGDAARFRKLTAQDSVVRHAFIGWEQGYSWGSKLSVLLPTLALLMV